MFQWDISILNPTAHIPFWEGEKRLVKPVSVEGSYEAQIKFTGGINVPREFTLKGESNDWKVSIQCGSGGGDVRVEGFHTEEDGPRGAFLIDGKYPLSLQGGWRTIDLGDKYEVGDSLISVLSEELRIYQDPDECHSYELSVTQTLIHPLVPIPGALVNLGGISMQIKEVVLKEAAYFVVVEASIPTVIDEKPKELWNDDFYRVLLELGGIQMNDWLVVAKQVSCPYIH